MRSPPSNNRFMGAMLALLSARVNDGRGAGQGPANLWGEASFGTGGVLAKSSAMNEKSIMKKRAVLLLGYSLTLNFAALSCFYSNPVLSCGHQHLHGGGVT